jgi:hypothetical protein
MTLSAISGRRASSRTISRPAFAERRRVLPKDIAIMASTATWLVNAFVDATPISGPA